MQSGVHAWCNQSGVGSGWSSHSPFLFEDIVDEPPSYISHGSVLSDSIILHYLKRTFGCVFLLCSREAGPHQW